MEQQLAGYLVAVMDENLVVVTVVEKDDWLEYMLAELWGKQ